MSELKSCPFCGSDRNIALTNEKHDHSGGYFIACPECDASTGLRYAMGDDPRPLLIEAWNRRAQPAITPETGNAMSQGAPAITSESVPLLSEDEITAAWDGHVVPVFGKNGINPIVFARAIESMLRSKLGAGVPMTNEERPATGERIASQARVEEVGAALVRRARDIVVGHQKGSISLVQRHLRIGYNTAAKLLEALEQEGVVSPQRQNGQREVLVLPDISGIVGKEGA